MTHYSYIKSNQWTHLLVTCIPYLQDSARKCKIVQDSADYADQADQADQADYADYAGYAEYAE